MLLLRILRNQIDLAQDDPGVRRFDALNCLVDRQIDLRRFRPALSNLNVTGVIIDIVRSLHRDRTRKLHETRQIENIVLSQIVLNWEVTPVKVLTRQCSFEFDDATASGERRTTLFLQQFTFVLS